LVSVEIEHYRKKMLPMFIEAIAGHFSSNDPNPLAKPYEEVHYGMHPAMYAWVFGTLSGISLPIGACLGIYFSPVKDKVCALMMAFGAGALLFAVTVELYGHALHQVASGHLGLHEMFTTIICALLGGAFYLSINQWLDDYLCGDHEQDEEAAGEKEPLNKSETPVMHQLRQNEEHLEKKRKEAAEEEAKAAEAEKNAAPVAARSGKDLWKKAKVVKTMAGMNCAITAAKDKRTKGTTKALQQMALSEEDVQHSKSVAFALFLGLLVDGVPEGVLMGFLAAEGHLTPVLIISLLIANFPEAFSSASLLIQARMSTEKIIGMWAGLCILVGSLAGLSCYLLLIAFPRFGQGHGPSSELPTSVKIGISAVEGVTGGAMIACIASVMLPEAFERAGKNGPFYSQSGFLCLAGFLLSASLKALFG